MASFLSNTKFIYEHMYTVSRDVEGHFFRTVAQIVSPLLSFNDIGSKSLNGNYHMMSHIKL
jgi:hypothetical protein